MTNKQIVELLTDIADILELQDESVFKIRAYREAARQIENLHEDVVVMVEEDRLTKIKGIGDRIAGKIKEYVETGQSTYRDRIASTLPSGLSALLTVPGVGAKKAQLFYEKLGITTIDELEAAAREHKLQELPSIQAKTEQNVLESIMRLKQRTGRMLLGSVYPAAERVVEMLKAHPSVERAELSGSIRRMQETIGDVDILVASSTPLEAIEAFVTLPMVKTTLAKGKTKASILNRQDLQIDVRVVQPESWGAALQYFTGSKQHNIELRTIAESKGWKLSEYGVDDAKTGERIGGKDEQEVYRLLGMDWIAPEMRQARGEIAVALAHTLPELVELGDIRGDMHTHTNWSDGANSIAEISEAARALGYQYLVISDHSVSLGFVHGLNSDRVNSQRGIIDDLNKRYTDFRVLHGIEVNIRADGTLDYDDEILSRFDVVTASIHSGMKQPKEQITARLISAINNPHVDIIGHPSGRLIGRRDASDFDREAVFIAAAETGTALEIDSQPDRLDLKDIDAKFAMEKGALFAINSDAHSAGQLALINYGVATARRGWVERNRVVNTFSLDELMKWLNR